MNQTEIYMMSKNRDFVRIEAWRLLQLQVAWVLSANGHFAACKSAKD